MAKFEAKDFDPSKINGGNKYKIDDGVSPDAINAPIEAAMFMRSLVLNQPDTSNANLVGTPSVSIVYDGNGNPKFSFSHLKGETGKDNIIDVQNHSIKISNIQKRVSILEGALNSSAYIVDDSIAYKKTVPDGVSPYAVVEMVGGNTVLENNVLKNAEVKYINDMTIPSADWPLLGIDDECFNYWTFSSSSAIFHHFVSELVIDSNYPSDRISTNLSLFPTLNNVLVSIGDNDPADVNCIPISNIARSYGTGTNQWYFKNNNTLSFSYPSTVDAKSVFLDEISKNPIHIVYCIQNPSLHEYKYADNIILATSEVTAYNENELPVRTKIVYQKKGIVG